MRAVAITHERGLRTVDLAQPSLSPDEARIRVRYCGICGSDLHMRLSPTVPAGVVMGHELMGVVEEVGSDVSGWAPGDRVVVNPLDPCGTCEHCRRGSPELCALGVSRGVGLGSTYGGLAETAVARHSNLFKLPDNVSDEQGALVEPLAVAIRSLRMAGLDEADSCVVLGGGPIGILAALALRSRGCGSLLVVEPVPWRRAIAADLGLPVGLPDQDPSVSPQLDRQPRVVFDCTGHQSGLSAAVDLVAPGGRVVIVGIATSPSSIYGAALVSKELHICGSLAYTHEDFLTAIDLLQTGSIPEKSLITTVAPMEQAERWFEDLASGNTRQLKVLLHP